MGKYIVAMDQGTISSRCLIFNKQGEAMVEAHKDTRQIFPRGGWVEQDPNEIWSSQLGALAEAKALMGIDAAQIAAIGITNQRHSTVVWDKRTGEPIFNALVWQCRRNAHIVDRLKADGLEPMIKEKTGLTLDASFSGTKIKWILDKVAGAKEEAEKGNLLFGTMDTWLMYKLSAGKIFATDYTNAAGTMLFNIHTLRWDDEILEKLEIPKSMLPEVKPSSSIYGYTAKRIVGYRVPVAGVAGDQQAALFGQCCFEKGEVKTTYGAGCFLLMNTGEEAVESKNGLLTTIAIGLGKEDKVEYALEGSNFAAGSMIQWLRDEVRLISSAIETEELALSVDDSNGAYVVPAFTGLGAPYWDQYARGAILGLSRGVGRAHLVRAALESIAYQNNDVLKAMEADTGQTIENMRADGGISINNFIMQFQADISNVRVKRSMIIEATALGAAYLAGLAVGIYQDRDEIRDYRHSSRKFSPVMDNAKRQELLKGWKKAVERSRDWAE